MLYRQRINPKLRVKTYQNTAGLTGKPGEWQKINTSCQSRTTKTNGKKRDDTISLYINMLPNKPRFSRSTVFKIVIFMLISGKYLVVILYNYQY
ncbi:unnamed protein product [Commensalibacter communis]|nr:unnamed protein product [Commensalibacter communis]CAI3956565.1 unnamed protein product [Commensalibacter communis]